MEKVNVIKKIRVTESIILKQIELTDSKDIFEGIERDGELLTGDKLTDIEVYSKLKNE